MEFQALDVCCPACRGLSQGKCEVCAGCGYVCPHCAGARVIGHKRLDGSTYLVSCLSCGYDMTEGWQYDADRELITVEMYLDDFRQGRATSREIERRKEIAKARAEEEANRPPRRIWKAG